MTTERYPMSWINHLFVYIGVRMHPAYWEFCFAFLGKSPGFACRLSWSLDPSIFMMVLSPFISRNSMWRQHCSSACAGHLGNTVREADKPATMTSHGHSEQQESHRVIQRRWPETLTESPRKESWHRVHRLHDSDFWWLYRQIASNGIRKLQLVSIFT